MDPAPVPLRNGSADASAPLVLVLQRLPLTQLTHVGDRGWPLALVGAAYWTGTEPYLGADMFWDHADTATYLRWCREARLIPQWHRFVPEGNSGHTLILAAAS